MAINNQIKQGSHGEVAESPHSGKNTWNAHPPNEGCCAELMASGLSCQHGHCGQYANGDHNKRQTHRDLVAALSALITTHGWIAEDAKPKGVVTLTTKESTGLDVDEIFLHQLLIVSDIKLDPLKDQFMQACQRTLLLQRPSRCVFEIHEDSICLRTLLQTTLLDRHQLWG